MWNLRGCAHSLGLHRRKGGGGAYQKERRRRKGQASSSSSLCLQGRIFSSFLFCGIASEANPLLSGDEILGDFLPHANLL